MARALTRVEAAHVRVLVLDLADPPLELPGGPLGSAAGAAAQWVGAGPQAWLRAGSSSTGADIVVLNKSDAAAGVVAPGALPLGGENRSADVSAGGAPLAVMQSAELAATLGRWLSGLRGGGSGAGPPDAAVGLGAPRVHVVSCRTGDGIDELCAALRSAAERVLERGVGPSGEGGEAVTRLRHRQHLAEAVASLEMC